MNQIRIARNLGRAEGLENAAELVGRLYGEAKRERRKLAKLYYQLIRMADNQREFIDR